MQSHVIQSYLKGGRRANDLRVRGLKMWETTETTVSIIPRGQSTLFRGGSWVFREAGEYRGVSVGGSCERSAET